MGRTTTYFLGVFFALLFLLGQGLAFAHDIEYGIEHDHDGATCTVSILGDDDAVIPAPSETIVPERLPCPTPFVRPNSLVDLKQTPPERAPPCRAPPQ